MEDVQEIQDYQPSTYAFLLALALSNAKLTNRRCTPHTLAGEREQRILDAIRQLRTRHSGESVAKAVSLLHKILSNIVTHPLEEKFRSIRKTNRVFESYVGAFPECLEFLRAVGFEDQAEKYVLVRQDPVLLWVGRATLEPMLPSAA